MTENEKENIHDESHQVYQDWLHFQPEESFDLDRVKLKYKLDNEAVHFLKLMEITPKEQRDIMAHGQRTTQWLKSRSCRITASRFAGAVGHCPYNKTTKILCDMLWGSKFRGNAATEWGNNHEDVAAKLYEEYMDPENPNGHYSEQVKNTPFGSKKLTFKVTYPNLCVPRQFPWAGVSPDGFVNDNGQRGGLEIKCPFKKKLYPVIPPTYFDQIQGSMGFLGLKFWDFVVWTPDNFQVRRYEFDEEYWKTELFPKLENFYMVHFLPAMIHKQHGRLSRGSIIPMLC